MAILRVVGLGFLEIEWLILKLAIAGLALSCMHLILSPMSYNIHSNNVLLLYYLLPMKYYEKTPICLAGPPPW